MPLAGGTRSSLAWLDFAAVDLLPAGGAAADGAAVDGAAARALAAAPPPTVTMGAILSTVFAGTPAFERSLTEEYGRPAMIFFAVAGPMPGSASRSAWEAVLRSTFAAGADLSAAAPPFVDCANAV